jgi:hypothetical protein
MAQMSGPVSTQTQVAGYRIQSDDDRVELIRQQVFESVPDPLVLWVARHLTAECDGRDESCELEAIYDAVSPYRDGTIPLPDGDTGGVIETPGLRFVNDPRFTDTYPTAGKILRWHSQGAIGEDCDGHTILVDSLANSLGWLTGAAIASTDGTEFVHVYPVVAYPKDDPAEWVPMDTTLKEASVGWWPPQEMVKRNRIYGFLPDRQAYGRELIL